MTKKAITLAKKTNLKTVNTYTAVSTYPSIPAMQWYVQRYNLSPHVLVCGTCIYAKLKNILDKYPMLMSKSYQTNNEKENEIYAALYIVDETKGIAINITGSEYRKKEKVELCEIEILYQERDSFVKELIADLRKTTYKKEKIGVLNLLSKTNDGFELKEFPISCPKIDFNYNYNEDFKDISDLILDKLSQENGKGVVLLYGKPGTGKTSYIRYIINHVDKRIIYMPPDMTTELSNPGLIPFLTKVPNSILIVEDAENVLLKRQGQHSQAISNILNLSDGLLSDCLNIQIIATFNTELKNIDEALMRKGRLIAKYEFEKLSTERTQKLAEKLGIKFKKNLAASNLADIYNLQDKEFEASKKVIGFKIESAKTTEEKNEEILEEISTLHNISIEEIKSVIKEENQKLKKK